MRRSGLLQVLRDIGGRLEWLVVGARYWSLAKDKGRLSIEALLRPSETGGYALKKRRLPPLVLASLHV